MTELNERALLGAATAALNARRAANGWPPTTLDKMMTSDREAWVEDVRAAITAFQAEAWQEDADKQRIATYARGWLEDWGIDLQHTADSYRNAAVSGKHNDRRIPEGMARQFARDFSERADAVYQLGELLERDILALPPPPKATP